MTPREKEIARLEKLTVKQLHKAAATHERRADFHRDMAREAVRIRYQKQRALEAQ